jgi:hypothetical protein
MTNSREGRERILGEGNKFKRPEISVHDGPLSTDAVYKSVEKYLTSLPNPIAHRHFLRFDQKTRKRGLLSNSNKLQGFLERLLEDDGATGLIFTGPVPDVHKCAARWQGGAITGQAAV